MLQLLHPIWLLSMAGILLPVLLHLWNNRQGKVLRIGSIALLEKGSRKQARSRKISEWGLLLLRCLLILLLALLLSGPFWRKTSTATTASGWILGMAKDSSGKGYQPLIDSLLKAGYVWHDWGSKAAAPGKAEAGKEAGGNLNESSPSYWDLFSAADRTAPASMPFYIFTSGRRSGFTGKRPVSDRVVHWFLVPSSTDSVSQWIDQAWLSSPDSIRVLTGSSRPTGNSYSYQMLPARAGVRPDQGNYRIDFTNGSLSVALDSQPPVIVDTAPLRVRIAADNKYNNDSRYLAAALHALRQFNRRNIQVVVDGSLTGPASQAPAGKGLNIAFRPDWLFWLSSMPTPAGLPAHNIVRYEPGREISVDTWVVGVAGAGGAEVALSRRIGPDSTSGDNKETRASAFPVIWKDGFGRPLLTVEHGSDNRTFHFFSRFDPAWNGLVWNSRFPVMLQALLDKPAFPAPLPLAGHDLRVLDPDQIVPQKSSPGGHLPDNAAGRPAGSRVSPRGDGPPPATDLAPACWLLLFLLFFGERALSFRSPKIKTHG